MRVEVYDQGVLVEWYEVPDDVPQAPVPVEVSPAQLAAARLAVTNAATVASLRAAVLRLVDVLAEPAS